MRNHGCSSTSPPICARIDRSLEKIPNRFQKIDILFKGFKYQTKIEIFKRVMQGSRADLAANAQYLGYSLPDRILPRVATVLAQKQPGTPFYPISSLTLSLQRFVVRRGMTMAEYHAAVEQWCASEEGKYWTS